MARLVIAGARYFAEDRILIPHYTGEFYMVDCTEYVKKDELEEKYDESFIKTTKGMKTEHEGETYYYAEYSPFSVDDEWELLDDVSELRFEY